MEMVFMGVFLKARDCLLFCCDVLDGGRKCKIMSSWKLEVWFGRLEKVCRFEVISFPACQLFLTTLKTI